MRSYPYFYIRAYTISRMSVCVKLMGSLIVSYKPEGQGPSRVQIDVVSEWAAITGAKMGPGARRVEAGRPRSQGKTSSGAHTLKRFGVPQCHLQSSPRVVPSAAQRVDERRFIRRLSAVIRRRPVFSATAR
jgi:hypothetical protein